MDTRFEVRDAQEVFEALADRAATGAVAGEGLINPQAIGVTGGSYGGGHLDGAGGAQEPQDDPGQRRHADPLGERRRQADADRGGGSRTSRGPTSPTRCSPTGTRSTTSSTRRTCSAGRIGVMKQSFVAGLYATGQAMSNYAPPGTDPDADLTTWYASINAGEPYDQNPLSQDIVDEITKHHSSYYIDHSKAPAPLLISNGWTDDLFPPDEAIRFYNRTRAKHPGTPVSLIFSDHGHQRGQNKIPDATFLQPPAARVVRLLRQGHRRGPVPGSADADAGLRRPVRRRDRRVRRPEHRPAVPGADVGRAAPGEVRFTGAAAQGDRPVGQRPGRCRRSTRSAAPAPARPRPATTRPGTASYRLPTAPAGGFTLMGSPTIVADINSPGPTSQLAARLLDVDPRRQRDARGPRPLPARDQLRQCDDPPGVPAPPERLEVRDRARRRSSSCCPRTSPTAATRTGRRRSPSRTSSCACRCSSSPARSAGSCEPGAEGRPDRLPALARTTSRPATRDRWARRRSGSRSCPPTHSAPAATASTARRWPSARATRRSRPPAR